MRALLDTNILIHREAPVVVRQNIGLVFRWLDRLRYEKCVHPESIREIERHNDERVRNSFRAKLASYRIIQSPAQLTPAVRSLSARLDYTENDLIDSKILNELDAHRVDLIISEDGDIHDKANQLGIGDRVFDIDSFLEKVTAENPDLVDYRVLSVRKTLLGNIDIGDSFFESFRMEYQSFDRWFNQKSEEPAYVCYEAQELAAFLYLKVENERESYADIVPPFRPKRRLKIGSFKVELNGYKLGERFLKIIFDNAIKQRVDEIYVTIFPNSLGRLRLIRLLEDFGFSLHGEKHNDYGNERVYVRDMTPAFNNINPKLTFPYISRAARTFLVPIYERYHTSLLPDSILRTESPYDFVEQEPHRNAIRKVYVSRSINRNLRSGDVIIFYRTGGYHRGVVTTIGIVENVHLDIQDEEHFIRLCRKRSVFSDDDLRQQWRYRSSNRPFIIEFLYVYSFPRRPNMASLIEHGVIAGVDSAPRGFEGITNEQFNTVLRLSETNPRLIVD
jgi:hypothetical protein